MSKLSKYFTRFLSLYGPSYEKAVVYMLQKSEYKIGRFLRWYFKLPNFSKIFYRGELQKTPVTKAILSILILTRLSLIITGLFLIWKGKLFPVGPTLILLAPLIVLLVAIATVSFFDLILVQPQRRKLNKKAEQIFKNSKAKKIAILGSYGKTTVKELLAQVLASKYKVAFTPGNMNTQVAHARFALSLKGDEDFIIVEYGEEEPGDIAKMAEVTSPDYAVITGMAPAHMDFLKSLDGVADELGSILQFVDKSKVFWNGDSEILVDYLGSKLEGSSSYSTQKTLGQKLGKIDATSIDGIKFKWGDITVQSQLLGQHMAGPLSLVAGLAERFGLSKNEIQPATLKTKAFDARMQPIKLGPATMINDGYNGNIEGIRAGIETLAKLEISGRKLYATPGLIAQGAENEAVHQQIAQMLAEANFDKIYLFKNANTEVIKEAMIKLKAPNAVEMVENPLEFLQGIQSFLAAGDVILVQNDLPDGA